MQRDSKKHFLLIGTMKAGTTSIFQDICQHPDIFSPDVKEPGDLAGDAVLTDRGRARYLKLFAGAAPGAWVGEASTLYTRWPMFAGVPERAKAVLGPDIRLVFVGRDPVARLRSQYRNQFLSGKIRLPLRDLDLENFDATHMSCYDQQLRQWLDVFPRESLLVLRSEDYATAPERVVRRIWAHLGAEQVDGDFGKVLNVSAGNRVARGMLRKLTMSDIYRRRVRSLVSPRVRTILRRTLIREGVRRFDDALSPETEARLRAFLGEATREYRSLAVRFTDAVA